MIHRFLDRRFSFLFEYKRDHHLDCIILNNPSNIRYFSDFNSSNAYLLVFGDDIIIITDPRYGLELNDVDGRIIRKVVNNPLDVIKSFFSARTFTVGGDAAFLSSSLLISLKKSKITSKDISEALDDFVSVADDETLSRFNYANSVSHGIEKKLLDLMIPGMREFEMRATISYFIHLAGCEEAFTPIVSFGENSAKIHTEPSDKQLEREMPVLIDYGVKYKGVSTDITRSFWYGKKPTDEYQKVLKIVKKSVKIAESHCKQGKDTSKAYLVAKKFLTENHENAEECLPHSLGHGLGYQVHQHPRISSTKGTKFKSNQIITLEPGIYIPGKFGIRIENDYLITEDGPKILTK